MFQIDRRGEIVSENTYRLNMARKEHKKHVRELLAQAIVHKTLDMERNRQVEIRKKLEEIAKIELVRRVRVSLEPTWLLSPILTHVDSVIRIQQVCLIVIPLSSAHNVVQNSVVLNFAYIMQIV